MTNKDEFIKLIAGIKAAYPNFKQVNDDAGFEMWYRMLSDIPYPILSLAIQKHIAISVYPPSIFDIRSIASNPLGETDWSEAWGIVMYAIRNYGFYRSDEALEYIKSEDETAYKVIARLANFRDICQAEDITYHRANFRMAYENVQKHEREMKILPPSVRQGINQLKELQAKEQLAEPEAKVAIETVTNDVTMPDDIAKRLGEIYGRQKIESKEDLEELERKKRIDKKTS